MDGLLCFAAWRPRYENQQFRSGHPNPTAMGWIPLLNLTYSANGLLAEMARAAAWHPSDTPRGSGFTWSR